MTEISRTNRTGIIHAVSVSDRKGVVKHNVASARLLVEHGLEGDAHAEGASAGVAVRRGQHGQMVAMRAKVQPWRFCRNLTVDGLEVMTLPVGTRLTVGAAVVLEITGIGETCHKGCAIRELVGDCVMPKEGVFARVVD